ncbi:MAG: metallophosphoesterase [DPANN group archaeon]|nr:metallophosphoesterase [DPANN group archaeon]
MKIFALGCTHGKLPKSFSKDASKADVIVCTGDMAAAGPYMAPGKYKTVKSLYEWWDSLSKSELNKLQKKIDRSYYDVVEKLSSSKKPLVVIRGNMYRAKSGDKFTRKLFNKYNVKYAPVGKRKIYSYDFISLDFHYETHNVRSEGKASKREIKRLINFFRLKLFKKNFPKLLKKSKNAIIVSHVPPYRCLDALGGPHMPKKLIGKHVGSKLLRNAIEKYKPILVICSHIHEARGVARIGKTTVVNVGSFGQYALINVEGGTVRVNLR